MTSASTISVSQCEITNYNIVKNEWVGVVSYGCYPQGRFNHAMCATSGPGNSHQLLIFGGQNMKYYCAATILSFNTSKTNDIFNLIYIDESQLSTQIKEFRDRLGEVDAQAKKMKF
jgi:hypothetical protein